MATSIPRFPEQSDSASSLDYKGEGCIVRGGVRRMAGPK